MKSIVLAILVCIVPSLTQASHILPHKVEWKTSRLINNIQITNIITHPKSDQGKIGRIIGILEINIKNIQKVNLINNGIILLYLMNLKILYSINFKIYL